MKRPFSIFPSIGYKNSQFQVLSNVTNLNIELYHNDKLEKEILTSTSSIETIEKFDKPGNYKAKCNYNGEIFEQEIEIKDALRLGSSEFKKAFVFDESNYSFFLMKDRLLLYDEDNDILLTENHYSPTEILQIDNVNFLFVTEIGEDLGGIVNLGIYSTDTFTILGELLNDYQAIQISPEMNKAWLFKKSSESIHCFELINNSGEVFTEIRRIENASKYFHDSHIERISVEKDDRIIFIDSKNINKSIEIEKTSNNAIDKKGTNLVLDGKKLIITNEFDGYKVSTIYNDKVNLIKSEYLYVGSNLTISNHFSDLMDICNQIKSNLTSELSQHEKHYYHPLPQNDLKEESIIQHYIFPTIHGMYVIKKQSKRKFNGVRLIKSKEEWIAKPQTNQYQIFSMIYTDDKIKQTLVNSSYSIRIDNYFKNLLIFTTSDQRFVCKGKQINSFSLKCSLNFYEIDGNDYLFVKENESHSIFEASNLQNPLIDRVEVHNENFINHHQIVWYSRNEKLASIVNFLNAFDLSSKVKLQLNQKRVQHLSFKNASDYVFTQGYILSPTNVIIDPKTAKIKDSCIGNIDSYSNHLNKLVSNRQNYIYLSVFNFKSNKYEKTEINLNNNKFIESYLSPSGQFLILQDHNNKYLWYDIEKDEFIRFFSGNFLAFTEEGNLIFEEDETRSVKIYDPLTFSEITPPNFHYYRFLSPDGKLYAQLSSKQRFINKLNGRELNSSEVSKLRKDLDYPTILQPENHEKRQEYDKAKARINENRRAYFLANKTKFIEIGIEDYSNISSYTFIKVQKFTEIGIVGTNITTEVHFPEDLSYYNYAAFSYDNKYFGYVGKPSMNGLIHLFKIDFDEQNHKLKIADTYISRYPRYASWVCGFSRTGYYATYDSTPDTYLIYVDDQLFNNKAGEHKLRNNIHPKKQNIYQSYDRWKVIKGKNFFCFSPSGKYLALSEQGYEPLTLGGYGHQESNAVHIAITETGSIVDSFTGHGDKIKVNKSKKVTFVAFSEDEKRIMTLSSDGVVIIRDINLTEPIKNKQEDEMPAANIAYS